MVTDVFLHITDVWKALLKGDPEIDTQKVEPETNDITTSSMESKPVASAPETNDQDVFVASHPLPLSPRLSGKLSGLRSPTDSTHSGDQQVNEYSVDRQMNTARSNLSDMPAVDDDSRNEKQKISQDEVSSVLKPPFKPPTHLITPSEIVAATRLLDMMNQVRAEETDNIILHSFMTPTIFSLRLVKYASSFFKVMLLSLKSDKSIINF